MKTLIRLGGCPGCPEFSLRAFVVLFVLSCLGSNVKWHSLISSFVVSWLTGVGRFSILVMGRGGGQTLVLTGLLEGHWGRCTNHFQNYMGGGVAGGGWPLLLKVNR